MAVKVVTWAIVAVNKRQNGDKPLCQFEIGQNKKKSRDWLWSGPLWGSRSPGVSWGNRLSRTGRCMQKVTADWPQKDRTQDATSAPLEEQVAAAGVQVLPLAPSTQDASQVKTSHPQSRPIGNQPSGRYFASVVGWM